jgi:hypothetical protein
MASKKGNNNNNNDSLQGHSPIGKYLPPGGYVEGDEMYIRSCPEKYDGPIDVIHYDFTSVKKTTLVEMEIIPFEDTYEYELNRYNRRLEGLRAGHIQKVSPEMMARVDRMIDRVNAQHRKDFCVHETVYPAKTAPPPEVNNETMKSILDIISELSKKAMTEEGIGKRKRNLDDEYPTSTTSTPNAGPLIVEQITQIPNNLLVARKLYSSIIIDRDVWPKWTHRWFKQQASELSMAIKNNALSKHQFNTIHKTYDKLKYTIVGKIENAKVLSHTKVRKSVKVSTLRLTPEDINWRIINGIKYRRKRRLCLNKTNSSVPSVVFTKRQEQQFPPSIEGLSFRMNNIFVTRAVNTRRETWKRRKKKD